MCSCVCVCSPFLYGKDGRRESSDVSFLLDRHHPPHQGTAARSSGEVSAYRSPPIADIWSSGSTSTRSDFISPPEASSGRRIASAVSPVQTGDGGLGRRDGSHIDAYCGDRCSLFNEGGGIDASGFDLRDSCEEDTGGGGGKSIPHTTIAFPTQQRGV